MPLVASASTYDLDDATKSSSTYGLGGSGPYFFLDNVDQEYIFTKASFLLNAESECPSGTISAFLDVSANHNGSLLYETRAKSINYIDQRQYDFVLPNIHGYSSYTFQLQVQVSGGCGVMYRVASGSVNNNSVGKWQVTPCQSAFGCSMPDPWTDYYPVVYFNAPYTGKTPALIIPGVLGTSIYKNTDKLWLDLGRNFNDVGDQFMDPLMFSQNMEPNDSDLVISTVITEEKAPLGLGAFDYIDGLIKELENQGYTQDQTIFTFPYDWRYGVSGKMPDGKTVADLLAQKIQAIMAETGSDKVDIVAHSTGGLLVKKYVMDHQNEHHLNKVVYVGVPNLGAPKAFKVLLNGDNFGIPFLADEEMKKISQNLPVVYDLAPSREYYRRAGSFMTQSNPWASLLPEANKDLSYDEAVQELLDNNLINSLALNNSRDLHSERYDNYDIRTAGVDTYNIVGCKTATFGKFVEKRQNGLPPSFRFPTLTSGDGTVPFVSAHSLPTNSGNTFFAPKVDHGKMPSAPGIRQEIVTLLSGNALDEEGKILRDETVRQNPSLCQIKGELIQVNKWADIEVADQANNMVKVEADYILNTIPGADYEIWDEAQFVFLPTDDNQTYSIRLKGKENGTLTVIDKTIENDVITKSQVFANIPSSPQLAGSVILGSSASINIDSDGDGLADETISPVTVVVGQQAYDFIEPSTTPVIVAAVGSNGNYSGEVQVSLSAADPVLETHPNQTSGVATTYYNLDGQGYAEYTEPIVVAIPGQHTIEYYSIDRAGNRESTQTITFTISGAVPDITPPPLPATTTLPIVDPPDKQEGQGSTSTPPSAGGESADSAAGSSSSSGGAWGGGVVYTPAASGSVSTSSLPQVLGITTEPFIHPEGALIKDLHDPTVFLIANGSRHPFTSARDFLRMGYKFRNVQLAWPGDDKYMLGMPVNSQ